MNELVDKAIIFATKKHAGQTRKFGSTPYILHPLEVAVILSTLTDDENTIVAGVLHDTVEDTDTTIEEIRENFGSRVYALVSCETEDKIEDRPPADTWEERKLDTLLVLRHTKDIEVKKMWLADKLSNIRSFHRIHLNIGDELWLSLNQKDKSKQEWYYRTISDLLKDLEDTAAYKEYNILVNAIFGGNNE